MNDRNKLVKEAYDKYSSYSKTGRLFNLSRQRIYQIVNNYGNTGRQERKKLYESSWNNKCTVFLKPSNVLHHKDFNNLNDTKENLQPLCTHCHKMVHKIHLRKLCSSTCKKCNRKFDTEVKRFHLKRGICDTCVGIEKGKSSGRNIFYPKRCSLCNQPFEKLKRKNGMCFKCYSKFRYHNDPEYKARFKINQKRYVLKLKNRVDK